MSATSALEEKRLNRSVMAIFLAMTLVLLLTVTTAVGAAVYRYTNGGAVTQVRTATTTGDEWSTSSDSWVAVAGAQTSVTVPGGQKAVLIITFSTEFACLGSSGYCAVAVYVDGNLITPNQVVLEYATGTTRSTSFQWISPKLNAGTHSIAMAGATSGTATLQLYARTLTVLRSKA